MKLNKQFFALTLLAIAATTNLMAIGRVRGLVSDTLDTAADIVADPLDDRGYVVVEEGEYPYGYRYGYGRRFGYRNEQEARMDRLERENRQLRSRR